MLRLLKFLLLHIETFIAGIRLVVIEGFEVVDIEISIIQPPTKEEKQRMRLEQMYKSSEDKDV